MRALQDSIVVFGYCEKETGQSPSLCAGVMAVKDNSIVWDSFEDAKSEVCVSENQHYQHYKHFVEIIQLW